MKRTLLSIVLVLGLTAGSVIVDAVNIEKTLRSVFPISHIVEGSDVQANHCTASKINVRRSLWITAAHCVDSTEPLFINREAQLTIVEFDRTNDIAIVRAEKEAPALKLAGRAPKVGDDVIVTGFPLGSVHRLTTFGRISSLLFAIPGEEHTGEPAWMFYMMFNVTVAPGNSGSAILNSRGEIIGVTQISYSRGFSPMMGGSLWEVLSKYRGYWQ